MSGGLVALLDDIATLAKATASSIDDVASSAVKVSAKAVGVVIDDTAVTPQYVSGLSPKRELPIIGKIAKASLINKLVVILPVALVLTWFAPQVLPFLLIAGGAYLCFEGGEKVLEALHWLPEHEDSAEDTAPQSAEDLEKSIVSSASRTDLILSAEIMLVSMDGLNAESMSMRVAVLIAVAFFMTFFRLAKGATHPDDNRPGPADNIGRGIVRVMPKVFNAIGVVGTIAMLWVGGHLVIENLAKVGVGFFHNVVSTIERALASGGGFLGWLVETACAAVFGIVLGSLITGVVVGVSHLFRRGRGH